MRIMLRGVGGACKAKFKKFLNNQSNQQRSKKKKICIKYIYESCIFSYET